MNHVLLIGGAPVAGKTSIATRLARRHGLRWYGADTRTWEHRDRAIRQGSESAIRWEAMAPRERWERPPEELLALSLHRERGQMVLDDLEALPRSPLVVAEGTPLPAAAVTARARAVWLIPTPEFHRQLLDGRRLERGPRELYVALAAAIEREARANDVPILPVDGTRTLDETVDAVEHAFAGAIAAGPRVETAAERRALLREANLAVVRQVRDGHARPWANGNADETVRSFLCECGDPMCVETVEFTVAIAAAKPVLAPGHVP